MANEDTGEVMRSLQWVIEEEGIQAGLRFLNARGPYRFTGIYRFDEPDLRSVRLFDRQNPELEIGADAPLHETYCSITGGTAAPFSTADAREDERLRAHPARETTLAYFGVPLRGPTGEAWGTLCHFDLVPQPVPTGELPLMERAASLVARALGEAGSGA